MTVPHFPLKHSVTRRRGKRWCTIIVRIEDETGGHGPCLTISGSEGRNVREAIARKEALEHWRTFYQDDLPSLREARRDAGRPNLSPAAAARRVVAIDGDFHGLDVVYHTKAPDGTVDILESCGQIRDTLVEWFPEVKPYFKWHLNTLHAECEHQEARGEKWATHPSAKCPDCGYVLGSKWLTRPLPPEVVAWAASFGKE